MRSPFQLRIFITYTLYETVSLFTHLVGTSPKNLPISVVKLIFAGVSLGALLFFPLCCLNSKDNQSRHDIFYTH